MVDDNVQKKSKVRFVDQTRPGRVTGFFFGPQPPDSRDPAPEPSQPPGGQPEELPPAATPIGTKADSSNAASD
jgi:hypothetical protein